MFSPLLRRFERCTGLWSDAIELSLIVFLCVVYEPMDGVQPLVRSFDS